MEMTQEREAHILETAMDTAAETGGFYGASGV